VITPGSPNSTDQEPSRPKAPPSGQKSTQLDDPRNTPILLVSGQGGQLSDPQAQKKKDDNRPGRDDAPVNIMAVGNRLIITSDDPAALALVNELVRLMTQTQSAEGDFEIIRLKNASATEAARILDEAFNGTAQELRNQ